MKNRIDLLTQAIRLLMVMVPDQRGRMLKEEQETYEIEDSKDNDA